VSGIPLTSTGFGCGCKGDGVSVFAWAAIGGTITGLGGGGGPAGASGSPSAAVASQSVAPTAVPAPTALVYTIKKNETLSKIATAHGITLDELLAANPQIKNPNKIVEGQQITIPVPQSSAPDEFGPSGSPAASQ